MQVGLFIPCYIDQFYPKVAIATLDLLESLGCDVIYPMDQTCCGQPMANAGFEKKAFATYQHFIEVFHSFDYIVAPSGSCVYHVRHHYDSLESSPNVQKVRSNTFDLVEFLVDVLNISSLENAHFPYRVGLHQSCHGQRGLNLSHASELVGPSFSKIGKLLDMVDGIQIVDLNRSDECCGFGGTFAINESAISVKMGKDRINDHLNNGVEVITAGDMSCLMHLDGIIKRQKLNIEVKHLAEILVGGNH